MQYMHEYRTFHVENLRMLNYPCCLRVNFEPYQEKSNNIHRLEYLLEEERIGTSGEIEKHKPRLDNRSVDATDVVRLR